VALTAISPSSPAPGVAHLRPHRRTAVRTGARLQHVIALPRISESPRSTSADRFGPRKNVIAVTAVELVLAASTKSWSPPLRRQDRHRGASGGMWRPPSTSAPSPPSTTSFRLAENVVSHRRPENPRRLGPRRCRTRQASLERRAPPAAACIPRWDLLIAPKSPAIRSSRCAVKSVCASSRQGCRCDRRHGDVVAGLTDENVVTRAADEHAAAPPGCST
jgi:hypothetical protein